MASRFEKNIPRLKGEKMNYNQECENRKKLLRLYRLMAGKELCEKGRTHAYKAYLRKIAKLEEEIFIIGHCIRLEDLPTVGEVLRQRAAAEAEATP